VLWARGSADKVVSDASLLDFGALGGMGYVPGWPGEETFPVPADGLAEAGGSGRVRRGGGFSREEVLKGCGHASHVQRPEEFRKLFSTLSTAHVGPGVVSRSAARHFENAGGPGKCRGR
jgi:hypothetical protein